MATATQTTTTTKTTKKRVIYVFPKKSGEGKKRCPTCGKYM